MKTLVVTLAVAATVMTPLPAVAEQVPTLTVTAVPDASHPQEVTFNGDLEEIDFRVSPPEAPTVPATAVAPGLTVTGAGVAQPVPTSGTVRLGVTATTPGMHSL